jgi:hypothetical protein
MPNDYLEKGYTIPMQIGGLYSHDNVFLEKSKCTRRA